MASLERTQIGTEKSQQLVFATCIYKFLRTLTLLASSILSAALFGPDLILQNRFGKLVSIHGFLQGDVVGSLMKVVL